MEIIKLNDKPVKCPKCGAEWVGDSFTAGVGKNFKPKCGQCGYVWGD